MNPIESYALSNRDSIIEQMLNDQIDIHSVSDVEHLLEVLPADDPDLHRKLADRLAANTLPDAALLAYHKAATGYLNAGMVLQAIVAKILEWSIVKPSHREGRAFHAMVRRQGSGDVPSQFLFSQLTYEEMVSLMIRLTRVRCLPDETVYDIGQEATGIYFIVSGQLAEHRPNSENSQTMSDIGLMRNDMFGDIFPLEETSLCRTRVTSTTHSELVTISKPVLKAICYRFPRIRELIERLSRAKTVHRGERAWKTVRRSSRYCLPADVELAFMTQGTDSREPIRGTAKDLSTGGICVALKNEPADADMDFLLQHPAALTILEDNQTAIDGLTGTVAWRKTVGNSNQPTHLVGIAFDAMAEETTMALNAFCTISNDEQDMIWNLWSHLVRH
jgi:CRP-like cAMP-binding protein